MLSAWKAKMSTSVASSAVIATGWNRGRNDFSNHSWPRDADEPLADDDADGERDDDEHDRPPSAAPGTGTVKPEAPLTSNRTIGANSTSMIRSFTATCTSV